ncbi:hypothetical protein [Nonomuraea dietziae]|uniref:hypothetical protein n=1 Tax=Nonomuraea dietziae TaxID=65515 RepID=UPI003CD07908
MARALAEGAAKLGVRIVTGVRVTGIDVADGAVHAVRLAGARGAGVDDHRRDRGELRGSGGRQGGRAGGGGRADRPHQAPVRRDPPGRHPRLHADRARPRQHRLLPRAGRRHPGRRLHPQPRGLGRRRPAGRAEAAVRAEPAQVRGSRGRRRGTGCRSSPSAPRTTSTSHRCRRSCTGPRRSPPTASSCWARRPCGGSGSRRASACTGWRRPAASAR